MPTTSLGNFSEISKPPSATNSSPMTCPSAGRQEMRRRRHGAVRRLIGPSPCGRVPGPLTSDGPPQVPDTRQADARNSRRGAEECSEPVDHLRPDCAAMPPDRARLADRRNPDSELERRNETRKRPVRSRTGSLLQVCRRGDWKARRAGERTLDPATVGRLGHRQNSRTSRTMEDRRPQVRTGTAHRRMPGRCRSL